MFLPQDVNISGLEGHGAIANCDHIPVSCLIDAKIPKGNCYYRNVWNFKRGDFDKLNDLLSNYNWDTIFNTNDVDYITEQWTNTFLALAKECIPYTSILVRPNDLDK